MKIKCPNCFRKKWFIFTIIVIIIIGLVYFKQKQKNQAQAFKTYEIQPIDLRQVVTGSGKITAGNKAILKFQTAGQLAWVGVKKGDRVSKWQAIASLDQRQLEKSLKQELIDYSTTRIDFDAKIDDNDANITNRNYLNIQTRGDEDLAIMRLLQKSQLSLDRTVLDVEISSIAKQFANLYSPINGIVIEASDINPGVNISPTTNQYVIVDPDSLRFSAEIEELDIAKIYESQNAIINLDAFTDEPINTQVSEIEFQATQNSSGNTVFIINFPLQQSGKYRLDMNGDVEIIISEQSQALAVPIDAIEEIENKKYVKILNESEQIQTEIKTGIETDDYYEVLEGLSFGDKIAIPE